MSYIYIYHDDYPNSGQLCVENLPVGEKSRSKQSSVRVVKVPFAEIFFKVNLFIQ